MKTTPARVIVPVRGDPVVFSATAYGTLASPLPEAFSVTVRQAESLFAIQENLGALASTAIEPVDHSVPRKSDPVRGAECENEGLAIANPNNSTTTVTLQVLNRSGSQIGTFTETLQANNHEIFTLPEMMELGAPLFIGSVVACASQPVGLEAIGSEGGQALFAISVTTKPLCAHSAGLGEFEILVREALRDAG
jgi:hypothetical protein